MALAPIALLAACLLADAALEPGRPAPDLGLTEWLDGGGAKQGGTVVRRVGGEGVDLGDLDLDGLLGGARKERDLADLHGRVVVVHTFDWGDATTCDELLPLVVDLVEANQDRELGAVGIASAIDREEGEVAAKRRGVAYPVALVDLMASSSPYADVRANGLAHAAVVGPSGELVWHGNPLADRKGFFAATKEALGRRALPRVERALDPALDDALAAYYSGLLVKAETLLAKLDGVPDADYLRDRVQLAGVEFLKEIREAVAKRRVDDFVHLRAFGEVAYPKGDVAKELKALEKDAKKQTNFQNRLRDNEKWLELAAKRPLLFPARKSREGNRFARQLEAFGKATNNSLRVTRTAQELLDRYRVAAD